MINNQKCPPKPDIILSRKLWQMTSKFQIPGFSSMASLPSACDNSWHPKIRIWPSKQEILNISETERQHWSSNGKSGVLWPYTAQKSVGKWLQQQPTTGNSNMANKTSNNYILELWQITSKSKFQGKFRIFNHDELVNSAVKWLQQRQIA